MSIYCFNSKSSPNLLFGMGQRPFQVNLHRLSCSAWLPLLDGLEYRRVLLCVGQQQCLCSSCRDVEHPTLRAGSGSYRRGEEWIVCCFGNHSMKGSIALTELLALLGLRAPPVEGYHLAQFAQFVRRDAFCSQACSRQLKHESALIETDHLSGTNGCERIEYRRKHRLKVASPVPVRLYSHGRHGFW